MSHLAEAPKRPQVSITEPVWQLHQGKIIDFKEAIRIRSLGTHHPELHTEHLNHHEHHEHGAHCNHDHENHNLLEPFSLNS